LNFSPESLACLSLEVKERVLTPGEFLIQKGQVDTKVYFLLSGALDVAHETPNQSPISF
jgi:CRP-like cAMP-binding protein